MTDVVLFHHIHGLKEGVRAFADQLSGGTHTVHTPDLYEGRTFEVLEEGFAFMESLGDELVAQRILAALAQLPTPWSTPAFRGACCVRSGLHRPDPRCAGRCCSRPAFR